MYLELYNELEKISDRIQDITYKFEEGEIESSHLHKAIENIELAMAELAESELFETERAESYL